MDHFLTIFCVLIQHNKLRFISYAHAGTAFKICFSPKNVFKVEPRIIVVSFRSIAFHSNFNFFVWRTSCSTYFIYAPCFKGSLAGTAFVFTKTLNNSWIFPLYVCTTNTNMSLKLSRSFIVVSFRFSFKF